MRMLEKKEILERLRRVQLLILDVDGVLTDGSINIGPDGKEVFKKFDVKDKASSSRFRRSHSYYHWTYV